MTIPTIIFNCLFVFLLSLTASCEMPSPELVIYLFVSAILAAGTAVWKAGSLLERDLRHRAVGINSSHAAPPTNFSVPNFSIPNFSIPNFSASSFYVRRFEHPSLSSRSGSSPTHLRPSLKYPPSPVLPISVF